MRYSKFIDEEKKEVVFLVDGVIEVRIAKNIYEKYYAKQNDEEIISLCPYKNIYNAITKRRLYFISERSRVPLIGHTAFGIIDRGTNLLQVRPSTGCNLNCIFCSVDEGKSKTRVTDYMVDADYIANKFEEIADFKRKHHKNIAIEAHIDGQGEPFLYPYIEKLLRKLRDSADIVSIQTNGTLLTKEKVKKFQAYIDRINLSINALNEKTATLLAGCHYNLQHVLDIAEEIASSNIDLLLAPVWVPGYNDDEIEKIVRFGRSIGAGKKWKAFGIQKYIRYKFGKKPQGAKAMDFKTFYKKLAEIGNDLKLYPKDFGIVKCKAIPKKFKLGEKIKLRIEMYGRMKNEMIAIARDRIIQIIDTNRKLGDYVNVRIIRNKHNIYVAEEA
ncbi:MAG: radical SAM protein [Thermoplasmata archaeon]|nr:MAG: radical SAM protein [Thermoplasmata archaeon]